MSRTRHIADARGSVRLVRQGVSGMTGVVEDMHLAVLRTLGFEAERGRGITGLVYRSIRGITHVAGGTAEFMLDSLHGLVREEGEGDAVASPRRLALLAALNGVMGDRLAADDNPLALDMSLHCGGRPLEAAVLPQGRRLLLLVHGLCLSERSWTSQDGGSDHAGALAAELGYLPLHLRYNTGLPIHENGRLLAERLEAVITAWPQPVEELGVLAHSMGGLVLRSALHHAARVGHRWPRVLRRIAFLGTPHHGAPLERAGRALEVMLGAVPYSAPLARIGGLRSAGITDLRHGRVTDAPDNPPLPLPEGVESFAIAATLSARGGLLAERLVGDGLVPLRSALGQHPDPHRRLLFPEHARWIAYRCGHIELLRHPGVTGRLLHWFR